MSCDAPRGEAIADAVHNLPLFLLGGGNGQGLASFDELYMRPLVARYPDLDDLRRHLPRVTA